MHPERARSDITNSNRVNHSGGTGGSNEPGLYGAECHRSAAGEASEKGGQQAPGSFGDRLCDGGFQQRPSAQVDIVSSGGRSLLAACPPPACPDCHPSDRCIAFPVRLCIHTCRSCLGRAPSIARSDPSPVRLVRGTGACSGSHRRPDRQMGVAHRSLSLPIDINEEGSRPPLNLSS